MFLINIHIQYWKNEIRLSASLLGIGFCSVRDRLWTKMDKTAPRAGLLHTSILGEGILCRLVTDGHWEDGINRLIFSFSRLSHSIGFLPDSR